MREPLDAPELRAFSQAAWARHLGPGARPFSPAALAQGSLAAAFHETAQRRAGHPALAIDGIEVTHAQLDERAARTAGWLTGRGVAAGDRVLLAAPTSHAMVAAYLGILRAGAAVVLANPTLTERELSHLWRDSEATLALGLGDAAARLAAIDPRRAVDVAGAEDPATPLGCAIIQAAPLAPVEQRPDALALLAYTSGTTGTPKAVPLTHGNLLSSIRAAMLAWRWREDDVLTHALPLFHQHGLGGVHATLLGGSRAIVHSRFDAERLIRSFTTDGATVLFAVPAVYEQLAAALEARTPTPATTLRVAISGSAPLSPALAERVERLLDQRPLERYGTTESGLDVSNPYDGPRRPGTVGLPLPGVDLAIVRDGRPLPDGEHGEIALRGPQVFAGYRGNAQATAEAFHPGGWFRTGDLGFIDPADGFLTISGRLKELIISGGMNVYPREVALVLEQAPGVAHVAVVGMPSARWGEEVVAAVVPAAGPPPDPAALIAFARERLAPYKCPKRVVFLDALPTNAVGKVVAADVVRMIGA
ncbi:MAG TPA: AMP-binding protein [Conexibacter sp.]|jgi:malonyl-CoA/methylmalonyl-CoA synthetase